MNKPTHVSYAFARLLFTALIAFARNVVTLMTGNAHYPTPTPPLAEVSIAIDTLETAVHDALDGGKIAIAARNAAGAGLLSLLRQLASYVQTTCKGDLVILLSSGFQPVKTRTPAGVLPPPANLRLVPTGTSGQLALRLDRVPNNAGYSVQTADNPDGPWTDRGVFTSSRGILLTDLTPGQVCWARACANGAADPSGWGGPVSAMAV